MRNFRLVYVYIILLWVFFVATNRCFFISWTNSPHISIAHVLDKNQVSQKIYILKQGAEFWDFNIYGIMSTQSYKPKRLKINARASVPAWCYHLKLIPATSAALRMLPKHPSQRDPGLFQFIHAYSTNTRKRYIKQTLYLYGLRNNRVCENTGRVFSIPILFHFYLRLVFRFKRSCFVEERIRG